MNFHKSTSSKSDLAAPEYQAVQQCFVIGADSSKNSTSISLAAERASLPPIPGLAARLWLVCISQFYYVFSSFQQGQLC